MRRSLSSLALKAALLLLPLLLLTSVAAWLDPLRFFRDYDDYYKDNFVAGNRELVCLRLYQRNVPTVRYDSFIFGSSRSLAFRVENWAKYLPEGSRGFHFDASGEGVYGIYNKMRYIEETGGTLRNALIVLDRDKMSTTRDRKGHLYVSPPELSKGSRISYCREFVKPLFDFRFVAGYLDYSLFRKYRGYMASFFLKASCEHVSNNRTGDLYYGYDRMIEDNAADYYETLVKSGVFFDRDAARRGAPRPLPPGDAEIGYLRRIREILARHGTSYRVVVSPCYDQIPLDEGRRTLLAELFGENFHDFSGVNRFTNSIYNYYEDSHYRPHVANEIMESIYARPLSKREAPGK